MATDVYMSIIPSIGFGLTALIVAIKRRHRPTWKIGLVLLLACAEITFAHAMQEISSDFSDRVFWYKMTQLGFTILPAAFLCLAIRYIEPERRVKLGMLALLSVIPLITNAMIFTNEFHGLMWDPAKTAVIVNAMAFLSFADAGFWYWIFVIYSYIVMVVGCMIFIRLFVRSRGVYSRQAIGVMTATLVALLGCTLDILKVSPFPPYAGNALGLAIGTISVALVLSPPRRNDVLSVSRGTIINSISDGIIVVDGDHLIVELNPAAESFLGKPAFHVIGQPLKNVVPKLNLSLTQSADEISEITVGREGVVYNYDVRVSAIQDWQGRAISWVVVMRDITEYKRTEDKLFRSESNLAEAQQISHVGSWRWDLMRDKIHLSEEMFRIAGLLPHDKEITKDAFNQLLCPDEAGEIFQRIQQNTDYPTTNIEHLILRPNGETRNVYSRIKAYRDENGKPLLLLGFTQDITERRHVQEEISYRTDQLIALHAIDLAIVRHYSLRKTLSIVLEQVLARLEVDAASVLILDPSAQTFKIAATRGFHAKQKGNVRLRVGEEFIDRIVREQDTLTILDLPQAAVKSARSALLTREAFVFYCGMPLVVKGKVMGVLEVFKRTTFYPTQAWLGFFDALVTQTAIAIDNLNLIKDLQTSNASLRKAYNETLEGWSRAMDFRDKDTEGHTQRVTKMTLQLARVMGVNEEGLQYMRWGALLHDVGKIGVPDAILYKQGKLTTDEEQNVMHKHPEVAYEMLSPISFLHPAMDIPYCHHEKWDGTGYPRGLKGEQIPLAARIFAVVDVWDALRSDRPYRKGWPDEEVYQYISDQMGKHFDPQVADAFLRLMWQRTVLRPDPKKFDSVSPQ
jgi:PAS domain S-box-containing protein/putative nucleotidyltransferase with HDIG domain